MYTRQELNTTGKARINCDGIFAALGRMYEHLEGAFACTAMLAGFDITGFRYNYGIRPLVLGSRLASSGHGRHYMLSSESVALQHLRYLKSKVQDIEPGQAVIIQKLAEPVFASEDNARTSLKSAILLGLTALLMPRASTRVEKTWDISSPIESRRFCLRHS